MFWANVERRMIAVGIQVGHAQKQGISNTAKSAYYRSATVLTATIVEGLVYNLVKKHTAGNGNIISKKKELKKLHQIPTAVFERSNVCICKENELNIHIDDDGVCFAKLNEFLKQNRIITKREFNKLDYVRTERNKLHLQGLNIADIGYTKTKVNKVSEPLDFLTNKLGAFNS